MSHACERWDEEGLVCPFVGEEEHEEEDDDQDPIGHPVDVDWPSYVRQQRPERVREPKTEDREHFSFPIRRPTPVIPLWMVERLGEHVQYGKVSENGHRNGAVEAIGQPEPSYSDVAHAVLSYGMGRGETYSGSAFFELFETAMAQLFSPAEPELIEQLTTGQKDDLAGRSWRRFANVARGMQGMSRGPGGGER